ncbi:Gfo/Idh/MocA family oxidoreductase, partial [Fusobacterium polymorphum]
MLNFAIVGCGRIANKIVDGIISNSKKAKLVAICDILEDKMDQIEKRYIEKTNIKNEIVKNSNYKELLGKVKVDVVI